MAEPNVTPPSFSWTDSVLWGVVIMFFAGELARNLISNEPFNPKKFMGEMIVAGLGGVATYSFGVFQGMSTAEIILIGSLAALGSFRMLEWAIRAAKMMRTVS